jgi:putative peptidoglycan lipid II flippase
VNLYRQAGSVGLATLLSRILGLVREQVIAFLFGAGNATDAFNVAFRIPNLLRNLFAEGAMSASLVPVFTRTRLEEGDQRAWRVAGLVFRVLVSFLGILTAFGIYFAADLAHLYAPAYQSIPQKFELTVRMTRIMFPYFPLVALSAAFMGVLNACGKFFLPALSSAFFNLASVGTGVLFARMIAHGHDFGLGLRPIEGMAIGVIVGGVVQAFCQLPLLYRAGYRYPRVDHAAKISIGPIWYKDPALRRMLLMMAPGMVGLAATQLSVLINTILATSQGAGAVSWLNYAFRLMQFPIGLFGVSLATATLPAISQLWVKRDLTGVDRTLSSALRHSFAINLPASAGLAFLGYPIIELIFQYGRFQAQDTQFTANALAMYAIGLTAYSGVKILVPACYAMGNTRTPVLASIGSVVVALILNLILVQWIGFAGLALGTSLGALLNFSLLICAVRGMLRREGASFDLSGVLRSLLENTGVALVMGVCVYFSWQLLESALPGAHAWLRLIRVTLLVGEGAVFVLILAWIFNLREIQDALNSILQKLRSRLFEAAD